MMEMLRHEVERHQRFNTGFSLALIDLDHFKQFNDAWGHVQGDECLRAVAAVLAAECQRAPDLVARYGGEEFALVLPETTAAGARDVLRSLLKGIGRLQFAGSDSESPARVSLSGGALTLVPAVDGNPAEGLNLADQLLYEAKAAGRKRVLHRDLTDERGPATPATIEIG